MHTYDLPLTALKIDLYFDKGEGIEVKPCCMYQVGAAPGLLWFRGNSDAYPYKVTLPYGAKFASEATAHGSRNHFEVHDGFDVTEMTNLAALGREVAKDKAERDQDRLEQLARQKGLDL